MAFAKRKLPQVVGVEASGEIEAVGEGVTRFRPGAGGDVRRPRPAAIARPAGRAATISARTSPASWVFTSTALPANGRPAGAPRRAGAGRRRLEQAACAPIGFGTVQHMLFDNAKLEPGESILVHAGGSGIGTAAIKMAKAIGCTVYTTVGDDDKGRKAKALGADR